jgi:hypothetical protein
MERLNSEQHAFGQAIESDSRLATCPHRKVQAAIFAVCCEPTAAEKDLRSRYLLIEKSIFITIL